MSRLTFVTALTAFTGVLIGGCADSRGGPVSYDVPLQTASSSEVRQLPASYKIAPLDQITVKVFGAQEVSGDFDVDASGLIKMPLIGEVQAVNLSTSELSDRLAELLGQKYYEHPQVVVAVKRSSARVVTIDGAVLEPGQYPLPQPVSLIQTIALARGTSEDANPRRVAIFRMIGGKRQAAAFDLTAIRHGEAIDPKVYPGDVIVIDGSSVKETERRVLQAIPIFNLFRPLL